MTIHRVHKREKFYCIGEMEVDEKEIAVITDSHGYCCTTDELKKIIETASKQLALISDTDTEDYNLSLDVFHAMETWKTSSRGSAYVYLMCGQNGLSKIGFSGVPSKRALRVSREEGVDYRVVDKVWVDSCAEVEAWLHSRYREKNVRGEFFDLDKGEIEDFSRVLKAIQSNFMSGCIQ